MHKNCVLMLRRLKFWTIKGLLYFLFASTKSSVKFYFNIQLFKLFKQKSSPPNFLKIRPEDKMNHLSSFDASGQSYRLCYIMWRMACSLITLAYKQVPKALFIYNLTSYKASVKLVEFSGVCCVTLKLTSVHFFSY